MEITNRDELRTVYREPSGAPLDKVIGTLDQHCIDFLEKSPFMVLSTADTNGVVDGSPKGGQPGFARVLDDGSVGWADSAGNNRLDSFENIVGNSSVALLFMIPGLGETLRINGTASLSTDPDLCSSFTLGDRPAKVVVRVDVAEAYVHCALAFRRSSLWNTDSWLGADELPNGVAMLKDHAAIEGPVAAVEEVYEAALDETIWQPGGE